ncbi:MAG: hypothetical protein ACAH89_15810 [Rariglobus sp.]|nr:hypothetical protein [Rariglobus sp.]
MNSLPTSLARLAACCSELESRLPADALDEIRRLSYGRSLSDLRLALLAASDPAAIRAAAELLAANEAGCACSGDEPPEPTSSQLGDAADRLTREALAPFTRNQALRDHLSSLGCRLELLADA